MAWRMLAQTERSVMRMSSKEPSQAGWGLMSMPVDTRREWAGVPWLHSLLLAGLTWSCDEATSDLNSSPEAAMRAGMIERAMRRAVVVQWTSRTTTKTTRRISEFST